MKLRNWMNREAENGNIQCQVRGRDGHEEVGVIQDGGRGVMRNAPVRFDWPLLEQFSLVFLSTTNPRKRSKIL